MGTLVTPRSLKLPLRYYALQVAHRAVELTVTHQMRLLVASLARSQPRSLRDAQAAVEASHYLGLANYRPSSKQQDGLRRSS